MKKIIIISLFALFALGASYMLAVGAVWAINAIVKLATGLQYQLNVWWAGLLVWVIVGMISLIKSNRKSHV